MRPPRPAPLALAFALLAAACAGPSRGAVVGLVRGHPGFPARAELPAARGEGALRAEGLLVEDHRDVLGVDLLERGIVPVALRVGVRGTEPSPWRLGPPLTARLLLEDGTPLARVDAEDVPWGGAERAERAAALELEPGPPGRIELAEPRFLFFRLPEHTRVDGSVVLVPPAGPAGLETAGAAWRELSLARSVLALDATGDGALRTLHVGLARARWPEEGR